MLLRGVGGPQRRALSREAVVVGTRQWWDEDPLTRGLHSKRRRLRRMLGVFIAIIGEVGVIGSNRRLGWQNRFKSVARTGAHDGIHPEDGIMVACGEIRVVSCNRWLGRHHHFESEAGSPERMIIDGGVAPSYLIRDRNAVESDPEVGVLGGGSALDRVRGCL
jgi:hypothetical protein